MSQWADLVALQREGLAKSIGVSNYGLGHLDELLSSSDIVPAVNQVEITPYLQREDLVRFCSTHGIACAAHSPLTKGQKLADTKLMEMASKYNVSTTQVLVRWSLQKGFAVIPKSARPDRIVTNAAVSSFQLSDEDLSTMGTWDEHFLSFGFDATEQA